MMTSSVVDPRQDDERLTDRSFQLLCVAGAVSIHLEGILTHFAESGRYDAEHRPECSEEQGVVKSSDLADRELWAASSWR